MVIMGCLELNPVLEGRENTTTLSWPENQKVLFKQDDWLGMRKCINVFVFCPTSKQIMYSQTDNGN